MVMTNKGDSKEFIIVVSLRQVNTLLSNLGVSPLIFNSCNVTNNWTFSGSFARFVGKTVCTAMGHSTTHVWLLFF